MRLEQLSATIDLYLFKMLEVLQMKRILVTTDLSEESMRAFEPAQELAKAFEAELTLLAVLEDASQTALSYAMDFPLYPNPASRDEIASRVRGDLEDLRIRCFTETSCACLVIENGGPVHAQIVDYAASNQVDLIVIASHGHTALSRILLGSVTERVVREASCPVLTIPAKRECLNDARPDSN